MVREKRRKTALFSWEKSCRDETERIVAEKNIPVDKGNVRQYLLTVPFILSGHNSRQSQVYQNSGKNRMRNETLIGADGVVTVTERETDRRKSSMKSCTCIVFNAC